MDRKKLEAGNDIIRSLKALDDLWHIFCIPHPYIHDGDTEVCLISLGEVEKDVKETMKAAILKNKRLLEQRLEEL